jgi:hypothetical protein
MTRLMRPWQRSHRNRYAEPLPFPQRERERDRADVAVHRRCPPSLFESCWGLGVRLSISTTTVPKGTGLRVRAAGLRFLSSDLEIPLRNSISEVWSGTGTHSWQSPQHANSHTELSFTYKSGPAESPQGDGGRRRVDGSSRLFILLDFALCCLADVGGTHAPSKRGGVSSDAARNAG